MPSRPARQPTAFPHQQAFWLGATVLVVGQLVAFWMLCSQQVHKAEVRNAAMRVERLALADCLRSVPNASLNSCTQRVAPPDGLGRALAVAPSATTTDAVPVNYVSR